MFNRYLGKKKKEMCDSQSGFAKTNCVKPGQQDFWVKKLKEGEYICDIVCPKFWHSNICNIYRQVRKHGQDEPTVRWANYDYKKI